MQKLDNNYIYPSELIYIFDLLHDLGELTDDEHNRLVNKAKNKDNKICKAS